MDDITVKRIQIEPSPFTWFLVIQICMINWKIVYGFPQNWWCAVSPTLLVVGVGVLATIRRLVGWMIESAKNGRQNF